MQLAPGGASALLLSLQTRSAHTPAMAALAPAAAEGLVASLARAQAELDWIRLRLEEEFARSCRKGDINTLSLLTRLNKLRRCAPAGGRSGGGGGGLQSIPLASFHRLFSPAARCPPLSLQRAAGDTGGVPPRAAGQAVAGGCGEAGAGRQHRAAAQGGCSWDTTVDCPALPPDLATFPCSARVAPPCAVTVVQLMSTCRLRSSTAAAAAGGHPHHGGR